MENCLWQSDCDKEEHSFDKSLHSTWILHVLCCKWIKDILIKRDLFVCAQYLYPMMIHELKSIFVVKVERNVKVGIIIFVVFDCLPEIVFMCDWLEDTHVYTSINEDDDVIDDDHKCKFALLVFKGFFAPTGLRLYLFDSSDILLYPLSLIGKFYVNHVQWWERYSYFKVQSLRLKRKYIYVARQDTSYDIICHHKSNSISFQRYVEHFSRRWDVAPSTPSPTLAPLCISQTNRAGGDNLLNTNEL